VQLVSMVTVPGEMEKPPDELELPFPPGEFAFTAPPQPASARMAGSAQRASARKANRLRTADCGRPPSICERRFSPSVHCALRVNVR
jgi:hypothetical protein